MKGRIPVSRTIYNNYALWETYPDEEVKQYLIDEGYEEDELTAEHYNYLKTQDINSLEELKSLIPPHLQPMAREQH